ncbi:putative zeta tubulin [Trypanosoma theileri]|uniref:Putative zeta tubulin n=1 Tax=Trypanosoma theileri TaxID=67003 RepID=A0A1X0NWW5_9TRYP|nr:putative zeta tubulin [Trypanosoma theileri]ORC89038.1 putative zeta tubulin [Trypanosoma theileri]
MAIVVVQVGQCGNQLGDELWRQLSLATNNGAVPSPFFTQHPRKARCVLIDSEPKVVRDVYAHHSEIMRSENVISGQSGRGNHWALGYYGVDDPMSRRSAENAVVSQPFQVVKDQRRSDNCVLRNALRAIYAETRRTSDALEFEAIVVLHSLAGGTGSGMTTRLLEKIRYYFIEPLEEENNNNSGRRGGGGGGGVIDEMEEVEMMRRDGLDGMLMEKRRASYLITITVTPQSVGELSTQGLNAALTLHALQENADAVLLLRNDDVFNQYEESLLTGRSRHNGTVNSSLSSSSSAVSPLGLFIKPCLTFKEANEVFVTLLLPIFMYGRSANAIGELVMKCSPNHREMNNILTILPIPQRQYLRYKQSVVLSRFYRLQGSKQHMPGVCPNVPLELIHTAKSLRDPDLVYSEEDVQIPKMLLPTISTSSSSTSTSTTRTTSRKTAVGPSALLLQNMEGVLVMNEARELNARVLFPLLRSAALKVKAGAFMSTFLDIGFTAECIEAAIHEVAERLADAEDV